MKKLLGLSVLGLAVGLASPTLADQPADVSAPVDEERGAETPTAEVTGRVVDIDHVQGALVLQTAQGLLALKGPPEALRGVDVGDVIRVRVVLREEPVRLPL